MWLQKSKGVKKPHYDSSMHGFSIHPKLFVFFDKKTGARRFEVKAGVDGSLPMERAVTLLAMHCVARQQQPTDFGVLVAAGEDLVNGLAGQASELMQTCATTIPRFPLSRRQREVLADVAQNFSNKEIAATLNVSVRTIKFHVSSLLEKFDVRGRVDLMLEATEFFPVEGIRKRTASMEPFALNRMRPGAIPVPLATKLRLAAPLDRRASR